MSRRDKVLEMCRNGSHWNYNSFYERFTAYDDYGSTLLNIYLSIEDAIEIGVHKHREMVVDYILEEGTK